MTDALDGLVEKAARAMVHLRWPDDEPIYSDDKKVARAALLAIGLPALLERVEAAEGRHEREMGEMIDDRDRMHDRADQIAYSLASIEEIGEHSSGNDPWENVIDHVQGKVQRLERDLAAIRTLHTDKIIAFDALAAKVADAGERIAQAIEAAPWCPCSDSHCVQRQTYANAALIARAALTEGTEGT